MLTTAQAAARIGVTPDALAKAAQKGHVRAVKFGRAWMFEEADVDAYRAAPKSKGGRPKKDKGERATEPGDYVLATKWSDGDPNDPWAIGFYAGKLRDRYLVVDQSGVQFRPGGFRRIMRISAERGAWILANKEIIETSSKSMWHWANTSMKNKAD